MIAVSQCFTFLYAVSSRFVGLRQSLRHQIFWEVFVIDVVQLPDVRPCGTRWDRYCALRRVGKATYVKERRLRVVLHGINGIDGVALPWGRPEARNQPHSGFASMDDGLSDKHPGPESEAENEIESSLLKNCSRCFISSIHWLPEGANFMISFGDQMFHCADAMCLQETCAKAESFSSEMCFETCGVWTDLDCPIFEHESMQFLSLNFFGLQGAWRMTESHPPSCESVDGLNLMRAPVQVSSLNMYDASGALLCEIVKK